MRKLLRIVALIAMPAFAFGAEPAVVQQLRNDLAGKTFTLSTEVASHSCIYSATLDFPTNRLVDTEINTEGGKRYFLRADRFMNVTHCPNPVGRTPSMVGDYVEPHYVSRMYRPGHRVTVKTVEAKADRIELQLTPEGVSGDDAYTKVKLMLGKGYESSSLETVETVLSRAIHIPRIEAIVPLRSSLNQLNASIADQERRLSSEGKAELRLDIAKALLTTYRSQLETQAQLKSVAFDQVAAPTSASRIEELTVIITDSKKQVLSEQVGNATADYESRFQAARQSCSRISDTPPKSLDELDKRSAQLRTAQADLEHFSQARQRMTELSQPLAPQNEGLSDTCSAEIAEVSGSLSKQRSMLMELQAKAAEQRRRQELQERIESLRREFSKLRQQRAALDNKLMTTLGGTEEVAIFAEYRAHTGRMIANRKQALDLGEQTAQLEINSLEGDLRKLR